MAKNITSAIIISQAMYNLYGDSTPPATVTTRAQMLLYSLLEDIQRKHDFWFGDQSLSFNTTAAKSSYTMNGDIIALATDNLKVGYIKGLFYNGAPLLRCDEPTFDKMSLTAVSSIPGYFLEKYWGDAVTDHVINLYPTPNAVYAMKMYYKRVYVPADWTTTYTSMALDELYEYLVNILTSEIAAMTEYASVYSLYAAKAAEALNAVICRNYDWYRQMNQDKGIYSGL
jgi:hypothetical protein